MLPPSDWSGEGSFRLQETIDPFLSPILAQLSCASVACLTILSPASVLTSVCPLMSPLVNSFHLLDGRFLLASFPFGNVASFCWLTLVVLIITYKITSLPALDSIFENFLLGRGAGAIAQR